MRERIAHLAARLMAEDGIQDFGFAKRKAAQQMGAADTRNLPNNSEIEEALRAFRALYQKDEHARILLHLRQQALAVMRRLDRFDPFLAGSVLSGTAGRYSDINLQIFTDSAKDVEYFLIRERIAYRAGEKRLPSAGEGWHSVPTFTLSEGAATVTIAVHPRNDLRVASKGGAEGAGPGRVRAAYLEALLNAADTWEAPNT